MTLSECPRVSVRPSRTASSVTSGIETSHERLLNLFCVSVVSTPDFGKAASHVVD